MMNNDAIEAIAFFGGVSVTAWAAAYAWGLWLKHRFDDRKPRPSLSAPADERTARLESAVDALAIEVERIGEAQRYAVKLLEQKMPSVAPR
ncbi:MAG TPA: hypothetical protein VJ867_16820 [Gemmatimonadaceae bacterium]|nr:hypothetical protein [Gemmatimonadaceae bacterium]